MKLSGSEIIIECLKKEGVEFIFGYPGGAVLHIYDALFNAKKIKHVLARHEQGATHAADGYARACGKPGVVLVTSGPGITNCVTGLATAHMDSIPMIIISGQVSRQYVGSDAFQEADATGITRPVTKHNFLVDSRESIADVFKKAFTIATTGRPGPVLIDIPKDLTDPGIKIDFNYPKKVNIRSYKPAPKESEDKINIAAKLLCSAKRPMIYTGGGIILGNAYKDLSKLVKSLNYPVTNTLMGLGGYPATDEQFLGMLGMHGTYEANMAMHDCDVLLAVGARFDDRVTGDTTKFCPSAKIIHIDIDPSSISKIIEVDLSLVGETSKILKSLNAAVKPHLKTINKKSLKSWWNKINKWRSKKCLSYKKSNKIIKPQSVIENLYEVTKGNAFVTSDVGQHQMWAAQYYKFDRPNRWINSGGLGTMGFGLPAAMGVQLAYPKSQVVCVTGEASIVMCIQELATCLQYRLPIKIINLNNRYMGMVRQWQEFFYEGRYAMSYMETIPDFSQLASSFGHIGIKIEKPSELKSKLTEAMKLKDRLVFVDVITDQEENVYPMIKSGKAHNEMHLSPTNEDTELA
ncbi:MAG: biosynthetic-type acetolactate synthase large subunit [Pseudomonadota bacterium]|nr:biosynthetic-type acetolactate synthase large subunit [Pseudomonadota bacterium]|tara:strand:- start:546 stop:2273 length:1728 start_codon:yes stop_codon:yes gene_type:complete